MSEYDRLKKQKDEIIEKLILGLAESIASEIVSIKRLDCHTYDRDYKESVKNIIAKHLRISGVIDSYVRF